MDRAGYSGGVASKLLGADQLFINFFMAENSFGGVGGNEWYCSLSRLDNEDKHIVLLPAASMVSISHIVLANDEGGSIRIEVGQFPRAFNGGLYFGIGDPGLKLEEQGEPVIDILFDKGSVLEGAPVIDLLKEFAAQVSDVIARATPLFRV